MTIPDKVTHVRRSAFGNCSKLRKIILGKKVEKISANAFAGTAIKEITFPASVKKLYSGVLCDNKKLRKVTFLHKKKLPIFGGNASVVYYTHAKAKKLTFCVVNRHMKSDLKKKLKKEKQKNKKYNNVQRMKKWEIKLE